MEAMQVPKRMGAEDAMGRPLEEDLTEQSVVNKQVRWGELRQSIPQPNPHAAEQVLSLHFVPWFFPLHFGTGIGIGIGMHFFHVV